MTSTWFITGAARGLGAATVRAALAAGDRARRRATGRDRDALTAAFGPASGPPAAPGHGRHPARADRAGRPGRRHPVRLHRRAGEQRRLRPPGHVRGDHAPGGAGPVRHQRLRPVPPSTRAVLPVMRAQRSGRVLEHLLRSAASSAARAGPCTAAPPGIAVEGFFGIRRGPRSPASGSASPSSRPGFFRTDFLGPARSLRRARRSPTTPGRPPICAPSTTPAAITRPAIRRSSARPCWPRSVPGTPADPASASARRRRHGHGQDREPDQGAGRLARPVAVLRLATSPLRPETIGLTRLGLIVLVG